MSTERPSYIPPENPFSSDEGKLPPEPTEQFVARYLGTRGRSAADVTPSPTDLLTADERAARERQHSPEAGERARHYAERAAELALVLPVDMHSFTEVVRAQRAFDLDPDAVVAAAMDERDSGTGLHDYRTASLALVVAEAGGDPRRIVQELVDREAAIPGRDSPTIFARCARAYVVARLDPLPLLTIAADALPAFPPNQHLSDEYSVVLSAALLSKEYNFAGTLVAQIPDNRAKVEALLQVAEFKGRSRAVQFDELNSARSILMSGLRDGTISMHTARTLLTEVATGFVAEGDLTAANDTMGILSGSYWRGYAEYALALARRGIEAGHYLTAVHQAARQPGAAQWVPTERALILTTIAHALVLLGERAEATLEDAYKAVRSLPDQDDDEQASKVRALLRLARVYHAAGREVQPVFDEVRALAQRRSFKKSLVDLAYTEADLGYVADADFAAAEKIARETQSKALSAHLVQRMARIAIKIASRERGTRVQ